MNDPRPQIDYARTTQDGRALTPNETRQLQALNARFSGTTYHPHAERDGLSYAYVSQPRHRLKL